MKMVPACVSKVCKKNNIKEVTPKIIKGKFHHYHHPPLILSLFTVKKHKICT